ncbi:hypothetical protein ASG17_07605 [Brevundimonas sp. Leaf363]|uniref:DnaT-like ssDNA-binding protein n=1 Tax=Brevundimonas sp. Leaf363 TaxID=1736353 RepID=UPI000700EAE7|nr:DnaT-like ssDNA-binding protein [Brevundimonas sp. Leaf363]KQS55907.1 hypothetical protein ASG17_07605 [Brevundimonas sp. Leaf363]
MAGYGDDAGLAAYLAANGYTLPVGAPASAVLRQRGGGYIDGLYGPKFSGQPTGGFAQERAWPRTGASAYGSDIPSEIIPVAVVQASYAAAWQEATAPGSLHVAASTGGAIKREKIGPIETEYVTASGDALIDATVRLQAVEGLLAPFLTVYEPAIFVV